MYCQLVAQIISKLVLDDGGEWVSELVVIGQVISGSVFVWSMERLSVDLWKDSLWIGGWWFCSMPLLLIFQHKYYDQWLRLKSLKIINPSAPNFSNIKISKELNINVTFYLLHPFPIFGFSFTGTEDSQNCRGMKGMIFIPPYHFHQLTNVQTFICNFAYEMTTTCF